MLLPVALPASKDSVSCRLHLDFPLSGYPASITATVGGAPSGGASSEGDTSGATGAGDATSDAGADDEDDDQAAAPTERVGRRRAPQRRRLRAYGRSVVRGHRTLSALTSTSRVELDPPRSSVDVRPRYSTNGIRANGIYLSRSG
jgi:hypothetical protein